MTSIPPCLLVSRGSQGVARVPIRDVGTVARRYNYWTSEGTGPVSVRTFENGFMAVDGIEDAFFLTVLGGHSFCNSLRRDPIRNPHAEKDGFGLSKTRYQDSTGAGIVDVNGTVGSKQARSANEFINLFYRLSHPQQEGGDFRLDEVHYSRKVCGSGSYPFHKIGVDWGTEAIILGVTHVLDIDAYAPDSPEIVMSVEFQFENNGVLTKAKVNGGGLDLVDEKLGRPSIFSPDVLDVIDRIGAGSQKPKSVDIGTPDFEVLSNYVFGTDIRNSPLDVVSLLGALTSADDDVLPLFFSQRVMPRSPQFLTG